MSKTQQPNERTCWLCSKGPLEEQRDGIVKWWCCPHCGATETPQVVTTSPLAGPVDSNKYGRNA